MECCSVTGEMTVAMVERCCADIDIPDDDNFAAFIHELSDSFLQHKVKVHFVRETGIGSLVWTIGVDQHEQTKVYDQGTTFSIQGSEITGGVPQLIRDQLHFMCTGI